ncbi:MAG TPA: hypothetical protein VFO17_09230 [Acidimicrobiia bacterium]|jgi:hypothetical protein|nr:hypothetical protein [Acidimicrobiia bacterium]
MNLPQLNDRFVTTRDAMHQIAFYAIAPARYQVERRMGLRATPGGFGTPQFDGRVARVEGVLLVHEQDGNTATQNITTVRNAARFFGVDYVVHWFPEFRDPLTPVDPDEMLDVDEEAALALADWFAFGFDVLEELRTHAVEGDEPSQVQLWPEHFDPATEMGDEGQGRRASFGASPGDPNHDLPYLYVSAWGEIDRSNPYWNDPNFNGSSLGYEEIRSSPDPKATALEFLVVGYRILQSG